jgi:hypothetical protein
MFVFFTNLCFIYILLSLLTAVPDRGVFQGIGLWRGVSKGVEDGRIPPTLQAGYPQTGCKAVSGVASSQDVER